MLRFVLLATLSLYANPFAQAAEDTDSEKIKQLIPAAAAMSRKDFQTLATATGAIDEDAFDDKSLTLMLFTLRIVKDEEEQSKEEFRFLTDTPKPSDLGSETLRSKFFGLATLIHADRITELTCQVEGDKATGTVSFRVPELYMGKVDYVAIKSEGQWKIVEFHMPARKIHIIRGESDKWSKK